MLVSVMRSAPEWRGGFLFIKPAVRLCQQRCDPEMNSRMVLHFRASILHDEKPRIKKSEPHQAEPAQERDHIIDVKLSPEQQDLPPLSNTVLVAVNRPCV